MDKDTLIFGCIIGGIVAAFGLLLHAMLTRQNDGPSLTCLALNVYFEARGESEAGQYAVAEVTMNRVASGRYADTVCGVVHQKNWDPIRRRYVGAFSWTELDTKPVPKGAEWQRARDVAKAVYYGQRAPVLGGRCIIMRRTSSQAGRKARRRWHASANTYSTGWTNDPSADVPPLGYSPARLRLRDINDLGKSPGRYSHSSTGN